MPNGEHCGNGVTEPSVGEACDDGNQGICKSTGTYVCDPANLNGAAKCQYSVMGKPPAPEACNNQDDDCDGVVDNPTSPGNFPGGGITWVDIGGGRRRLR